MSLSDKVSLWLVGMIMFLYGIRLWQKATKTTPETFRILRKVLAVVMILNGVMYQILPVVF